MGLSIGLCYCLAFGQFLPLKKKEFCGGGGVGERSSKGRNHVRSIPKHGMLFSKIKTKSLYTCYFIICFGYVYDLFHGISDFVHVFVKPSLLITSYPHLPIKKRQNKLVFKYFFSIHNKEY